MRPPSRFQSDVLQSCLFRARLVRLGVAILLLTPSLAAQSAVHQQGAVPTALGSNAGQSEILLLSVGRTDDPASARVLASGARNAFGNGGLAWEGNTIAATYVDSQQSTVQRIFIPITPAHPARANDIGPFQCSGKGPDGFLITQNGARIDWTGRDRQLLTTVLQQISLKVPPCAPDTTPLFFAIAMERILSVIPGASPPGPAFAHAAVAPDGFRIAYFHADAGGHLHLYVADRRDHSVSSAPDPPPGVVAQRYWNPTLAWTSDGKSVAYIVAGPKGENLWLQKFGSRKSPALPPPPNHALRYRDDQLFCLFSGWKVSGSRCKSGRAAGGPLEAQ
jgi:hypothetical protein